MDRGIARYVLQATRMSDATPEGLARDLLRMLETVRNTSDADRMVPLADCKQASDRLARSLLRNRLHQALRLADDMLVSVICDLEAFSDYCEIWWDISPEVVDATRPAFASAEALAHRTLQALRATPRTREAMIGCLSKAFAVASARPKWLTKRQSAIIAHQTVVALIDDVMLFELLTLARPLREIVDAMTALPSFQDYEVLAAAFGFLGNEKKPPPCFDASALDLPAIKTLRDLADWLGIDLHQLDWFAGLPPFRPQGSIGSLVHYRYTFHDKPKGPPRLIEAPKSRLKAMQGKILREILDRVPVHAAAHGFVKNRSVVTSATPHAGEEMLIVTDLADFFPSVRGRRVFEIFRALGYSPAVATRLAGLTTTITPPDVFGELPRERRHDFVTRRKYTSPHLAQGAPTSPALANLAAYRLDVRLTGLARRFRLAYTRYADDLAFSGATLGVGARATFMEALNALVLSEGFSVRADKTRHLGQSAQQRLLGMSVNRHLNLPRAEFDRLKAILHLSARHGPDSQNRDSHADFRAHLLGRIQWAEHVNAARGAKLRRLFERIVWPVRG